MIDRLEQGPSTASCLMGWLDDNVLYDSKRLSTEHWVKAKGQEGTPNHTAVAFGNQEQIVGILFDVRNPRWIHADASWVGYKKRVKALKGWGIGRPSSPNHQIVICQPRDNSHVCSPDEGLAP